MSKRSVLNFDDILNADSEEPIHTTKFEAFDREWTLLCDLNTFALSNVIGGADPGAITKFMVNLIDPAQRAEFVDAMSNAPRMTGEKMGAILNRMVEAASERPTQPPSGSQPGGLNRTSARKSAASSAKPRVVRSTS